MGYGAGENGLYRGTSDGFRYPFSRRIEADKSAAFGGPNSYPIFDTLSDDPAPHDSFAVTGPASAKAQLGYASGTRTLYEQELQITESLNDLHGSAIAHNNLAKFLEVLSRDTSMFVKVPRPPGFSLAAKSSGSCRSPEQCNA